VATWLGQKCEIGGGHDLFEMGIISEERRVEGEISIGCVRSYSNVGITGAEVNGLRSGDACGASAVNASSKTRRASTYRGSSDIPPEGLLT
jgi:hypothetical protein